MTKRLLFLLFATMMVLAACQPVATPAPTQVPSTVTPIPPTATTIPPSATPAAAVLELVGVDGAIKPFSLDQLKALTVTTGQGGIKSSTGKITLPLAFTGIALKDLVKQLGTFDETMGLSVEASDGYAITFSYAQVMTGNFIEYDPGTGDELKSPVPLTAILAYEMDGKLLDAQMDGALRVAIVSSEPKQVIDGHWSVKFVTKVTAKSLSKDWTLELDGNLHEKMDRATFESGASPNCHGVSWTDDKAQKWVGIPLWLMVGRVDDTIKHEGPAFNDALADIGYKIDVVASDGYTVTFESARIKRNNNIIVAFLVDENPLPDKYFPLRLVGSDLQKNEMVGQIAKIVLHLEGVPTPIPPTELAPTETPSAEQPAGTLVITGLVDNILTLTETDLRAMDVVTITAKNSKGVEGSYTGVRLSVLLAKAGLKPDAKTLVFTASDGFTGEVFLTEVTACPDCMVAFTDTPGDFKMVMPGLPGSAWVKDVIKIEVK